jgi:hypothetical protein
MKWRTLAMNGGPSSGVLKSITWTMPGGRSAEAMRASRRKRASRRVLRHDLRTQDLHRVTAVEPRVRAP